MLFLNRILNIGVDSGSDIKRIRILNGIAFFSALVLIFNGIMIYIGSYPFEKITLQELFVYLNATADIKVSEVQKFRIIFPVLDFILAAFAFTSLLLNHLRKYMLASIVICLITNLYIAFFYWLSGYFSVFFFFIPGLLPLIFFQKKRHYFPFLFFTLVVFIVFTIIKYHKGISDLFLQPPADRALQNSLLNFTAVFGILYFIIFHFKNENFKNEKILQEKNKILDQQAREIQLQSNELHTKNNELLASEKELKEFNDTKDKFISILAHDLRSPFNSLFGFSKLLLESFRNYSEKQIEEQLKSIYQVSKTTYDLLEQILLWANSQTGRLVVNPEKFGFMEITQNVIDEFKNLAQGKNININSSESGKIILQADKNMFKTVMRNLITNAIKFTNENGRIDITAKADDKNVTITVSDNGTGINEHAIPKLWEIKEYYSTEGTNRETGSGFGLKLCKELIDKHKGDIWVKSTVGIGSDFTFTLPLVYR